MCCSKLLRLCPPERIKRYRPNVGLLTPATKNDVGLSPDIIPPDPFASDDCLNDKLPDHQLQLAGIEDVYTMNTGEDESSSGLNGRLRPRKSTVPSPQSNKLVRKSDGKSAHDRPKRTITPSKASSAKQDDLSHKSELPTALQLLCPYCDRKFASKQAISKHVRRIHFASSKQNSVFGCLFCKHNLSDTNEIIRHMVDSHPNQYFACLDCHTRFPSTTELAEHKLNVCDKQKVSYRNKLRQKTSPGAKKNQKSTNIDDKDRKDYTETNRFNGIVISCELKPSQVTDNADIEDNITTNLILPPSKALGTNAELEKSAVIVLDDLQWSKRMPANFSFHNTDADQILSRLGVVHRSPRTSEFTKKDWLKNIDESTQKFEKCFDTTFYSKVASNVQENLSKFLDGSFNFNPDADSTIKTRKLKNSVVINTAEGFPILLACEQFSRTTFDGYIPRTIAPKHKWKWDNEKTPMNPDDIKRDSHVNSCIITLVSSLDIWTQLCMRRKFEDKFNIAPLEKKTEKQNTISKELKEILESREIPSSSSSQVVKYTSKPHQTGDCVDFPASLGLRPAAPTYDLQPAVLSGEWVRPRCYVCCACGAQTRDSRGLSSHITTHHPNAQVQHYEIVGELLLNADILKHLYVPPSFLSNRTRPLRGFRECTKCKKSISLEDLHQHMLDCAGDTPTVRRKCRYRPFGVRRRRPRLPDNTIRKKIRKDIRRQTRQTRQKNLMRPRPKIRSEVGDAESIRKMIADLPAKRHRSLVNPTNPILRPRKKMDQQRNKFLKRRTTDISQSRKQQDATRTISNRLRSGPSQEDVDDKTSVKDEDDKPLKPRLKRLVSKKSHQSETFKRKVALNRANRRARLKEQPTVTEDDRSKTEEQQPEDSASVSGSFVEQLSIGNTPQKIDVNSAPYNTRDHSSRNRNNNINNNDQARSGSSRQNGNTNDDFVPAPNEPLKHSIARLTSDTDLNDKTQQHQQQMSVMQKECDSLNQHVPDGQQRQFENEAVATKLDKPPLDLQEQGNMDALAQKNKLNKPRKGLNDCIAMLKNKLVDPVIPMPLSQSVECSSVDPLLCHSATATRRASRAEYDIQITTRPAEIFSRHVVEDRMFQLRNESNIIPQSFADIPLHFLTAQKLYDLPQRRSNKIDKAKPPKQKHSVPRRESTRRRSTRNEKDSMRQKKYILPPNIELIPHIPSESYERAKVSPTSKVDIHTQNFVNIASNDKNKTKSNLHCVSSAVSRKQINERQDFNSIRPSLEINSRRLSNETHLLEIKQTESEARLRSQSKVVDTCAQSQTRQLDTYTYPQTKQANTYSQTKHKTKSQHKQDAFAKPPQSVAETYTQCHLKQNEVYPQTRLKKSDVYAQSQMKHTEVYPQSELKQTEVYSEPQLKQSEGYPQPQLKQADVYSHCQLKQSESYSQSQLTQSEVYAQSQVKLSEAYSNIQLSQADIYSQSQLKSAEVYSQPQLNETESFIQSRMSTPKPTCVYPENFSKNKDEIFSDCEVPRILITHDIYSENNFNSGGIQLLRTNSNSSNLGSAVPLPLDLSVNISESPETCSKQSTSYESNDYDSYGTLDLSNKSVDLISDDIVVDDMIDGVVDLRVKNTQKSQNVKTSSEQIQQEESATDLTLKTLHMENIPTDLTVRRKSAVYEYEHLDMDYECVQDLSKHAMNHSEKQPQLLPTTLSIVNQDMPTDLSGKKEISPKPKSTSDFVGSMKGAICVVEQAEGINSMAAADLSAKKQFISHRIDDDNAREVAFITPTNEDFDIDVEKSQDSFVASEVQSYGSNQFSDTVLKSSTLPTQSKLTEKSFDKSTLEPKLLIDGNDPVGTDSSAPQVIVDDVGSSGAENIAISNTNKDSIISQPDHTHKEKSASITFCQSDVALPLYTLSNNTTNSRSKYETTMPVYTLANACISMSKVEPSNVTLNQESTLGTPGTTMTKNASMCSKMDNLSDTVVAGKSQNTSLVNKTPMVTTSKGCSTQNTFSAAAISIDKSPTADKTTPESEIDPETAKKIALLPKELVEILGTMPVDHRNQLLNVLPHYVSKSPTGVQPKGSNSVMPGTFGTAMETSHMIATTTASSHAICALPTQNNDEIKPFARLHDDNKITALELDNYNTSISNDVNRVIDLTEDEAPIESNVNKRNPDEISGVVDTITLEPSVPKPNKPKASDQTASLRAVRIKAPSERNKSICLENSLQKASVDQQIKMNVQTIQNLQVTEEKSLDLDKTMAIQQAEVSSTQHNTTSTGKYPLAISPASTGESSNDESSKSVIPNTPTLAVDTEIEKLKEQSMLYHIPLPNAKVTSSVSSKEKNPFNIEPAVNEDSHNTSLAIPSSLKPLGNMSLLSSTNKTDKSFELASESIVTDLAHETTKLLPCSEANSIDPEDSEDDITLAAIVKQKQRHSKTSDETIGEMDTKKKKSKKPKKGGRKSMLRTSSMHKVARENISAKSSDRNLIDARNNIDSKALSPKNNNNRNADVQVEVTSESTTDVSELNKYHLESSEKDNHLQSFNKNLTRLSKKSDLSDNTVIQDMCKENKSSLNNSNENLESVLKLDARKRKEKVKKNSSNAINKKCVDGNVSDLGEEDCQIRENETDNKEIKFSEHRQDGSVKRFFIEEISHAPSANVSKEVKTSMLTTVEVNDKVIESLGGVVTDKTVSCTKNNLHILTSNQELLQDSDSKDNLVKTPLRRSRRGKSLFMDNHSTEKEKVNEAVYEHKTPLTKKQLIFSKLLLDEGKPENDNLIADKSEDQNSSENSKTAVVLNPDPSDASPASEFNNQIQTVLEKSKSIKRRISPHSTRKSKKKKSIEININKTDDSIKKQLNDNANVCIEAEVNSTSEKTEDTVPPPIDQLIDDKSSTYKNESFSIPLSQEMSTTSIEEESKSVDKLKALSEKRKIDNLSSCDLMRSSKPKKCKTSKVDKKSVVLIDENKTMTVNSDFHEKDHVKTERFIAEKSVAEKSVAEKTDAESVAEKRFEEKSVAETSVAEKSVSEKTVTEKYVAEKSVPEKSVSEKSVSEANYSSLPRTACYNILVPARRGRSKSVVVKSSTSDLYDPYDIDLEDMIEQHESFRRKKKSSEQKSGVSQKKIKICPLPTKDTVKLPTEKESTIKVETTITKEKSTMSDSDDSSKSDVPLQKYVEEKEKKKVELNVISTQKKNNNEKDGTNYETEDIKFKESTSGETLEINKNEAEQKLRSEQFMESFGFFSERKPRKSNLLATKKISETFHTNNESDDMYFGFKERSSKKGTLQEKDSKKVIENESLKLPQPSSVKKSAKRGRKKKSCTKILPSYCDVCKKEFRRPDNFLRHQMTLLHISKLSEVEMKVKTAPVHEEPNYLMAYKQYLERFRKLTDKLSKLKRRNPKAASKIVLPTMQEILSDVNRAVREQQLSQRGLSHDEELFIDCCELLKESHNGDKSNTNVTKSSVSGLDLLENAINTSLSNDCDSDDDVDSITAQNILDSEEVRNLENDLISGLKEAAKATLKSCSIQYDNSIEKLTSQSESHNGVSAGTSEAGSHYEIVDFDISEKPRSSKTKKYCSSTEYIQIKEKMYPDVIEDIDMFEDKFDKIKRKCRSQAAAAKQTTPIVESCTSHKVRRKSEKKKGKRNSKKTRHQSTQVPTKGALKGFDGIKVSIPTSDINLAAIVPVAESSKKKKKTSSKKKKDKKESESSCKYDSDNRVKEGVVGQNKKLDVYEFMDNEDAELFEFRPSTLMERFKSISNKETPSASKFIPPVEENSSESGSDGDDFVYMSDDYVCSDDETENSLLSCENSNAKLGSDIKKMVPPPKRKDVVEKNAVMGKIFKHNAVRTEKKIIAPKEPVKPKANLDQLFDSLLEEEPSTSMLNSEQDSTEKHEELLSVKKHSASKYDSDLGDETDDSDDENSPSSLKRSIAPDKNEYSSASTAKRRNSSSSKDYGKDSQKHESKKYILDIDYKASTSKKVDSISTSFIDYGPSTSKKYEASLEVNLRSVSPDETGAVATKDSVEMLHNRCDSSKLLKHSEASTSKFNETIESHDVSKSSKKKDRSMSSSYDYGADVYDQSVFDEAGVARQRARRKCTVGKQNVLAESWSSESEPDGGPPRPNSVESVVAGSGRKKKARKKDAHQAGGRRGNNRQVTYKRHDIESRVSSSNRNTSSVSTSGLGGSVDDGEVPGPSGLGNAAATEATAAKAAADAAAAEAAAAAAMPAPSTSQTPVAVGQKGRPRSVAYYWSSEGDDEQEHQQQHGWIVGDSHKKLVTMLAHAKGRKRNNDEKRHLVE